MSNDLHHPYHQLHWRWAAHSRRRDDSFVGSLLVSASQVSDHHISKENSVGSRPDQLESKLLESKYFTDEDPVLVPADVPDVVHLSQQGPFRINKFRYGSR
jgi:hypothetical protein